MLGFGLGEALLIARALGKSARRLDVVAARRRLGGRSQEAEEICVSDHWAELVR